MVKPGKKIMGPVLNILVKAKINNANKFLNYKGMIEVIKTKIFNTAIWMVKFQYKVIACEVTFQFEDSLIPSYIAN